MLAAEVARSAPAIPARPRTRRSDRPPDISPLSAWLAASERWPTLLEDASPTAWEGVLGRPNWVQVWNTKDEVIFGYVSVLGLAAETDDPDLYLEEPEWVNPGTGVRTPIGGTEGMIIKRSDIRMIQVLTAEPPG